MPIFKKNLRRFLTGLPLVAIILASFYPMQQWAHQALVLFTLLWLHIFLLFEVFGVR